VSGLRRCLSTGLIVLFAATITVAQTQDQVRQQAESRLRQMSPSEIEQALKQYGLTLDEATKRAQSMGVSLQDYLARPSTTAPGEKTTEDLPVDPRLNWQRTSMHREVVDSAVAAFERERSFVDSLIVPGFKGRSGIDSTMQPFGYEVFRFPATTFLPSLSVATPPSYVLGAGDEIVISVWGETYLTHRLQVNREGNVFIPDVGPVTALGLTMQKFRELVQRRMSAVYSGLAGTRGRSTLDVSLSKLKTIQVFVLGEVRKPGGYALSSMSTALHALYLAGGPTADGSLRDVQVLRRGETAHAVDIYAFVLGGDRTTEEPLQDGDIVFVKPAGNRVAVAGKVLRPAIYELKPGETLGALIGMAGGLRFDADVKRVHVERIVPFDQRRKYDRDLLDFDVHFGSSLELLASPFTMENGDIVLVQEIIGLHQNRVVISGSVNKPGPFAFHPGMTVADLIMAADSLRRSTFDQRATLYRMNPNLHTEVIGFNLELALKGDPSSNLVLENEDSVVIYPYDQFHPRQKVSIFGAVRYPGEYIRHDSMTVADLVMVAGGLVEGAMRSGWELARLDTQDIKTYARLMKIGGDDEYWRNDGTKGMHLEDFDVLTIPSDPRFSTQKFVKMTGYVNYPGTFAIQYEGERLASIFKRAGGLRPGAYLQGSRLIRRFNNAGLIPLDFKLALEKADSRDNVVMYDGDSIQVAYTEDVVYVSGEVYVPSPVLYEEGKGLSYYIDQAGGYKEEAESGNTVVFLPGGKKWDSGDILPGSTVMVPRKIEKEDKTLPLIRDLATMLASLAAITVALIQVTK
jgi:polysaccharide biosynthesis/export protein